MADKPINYFRAMQILAMRAVLKPDGEYLLRRIYRYYSHNFNTPLHIVETLPLADILTHYYEHVYENMEEPRREQIRERLAMTEEEIERAALDKEDDDEDDEAFLRMVEQEEQARLAKQSKGGQLPPPKPKAAADDLPDTVEAPPDIQMKFKSDKEFADALSRWDERGT